MRTLAQLQAECTALGLSVPTNGKPKKEDYVAVLRMHHWRKECPDEPLPSQIQPMLLGKWEDLDEARAAEIEQEGSGWIVQPKLDGVRVLLHVEDGRVRITSRCVSEVSYRLGEFQENVPHLTTGLSKLTGTILDGELICPVAELDTESSVTAHPLQATVAVISTTAENARQIQARHGAHLQMHVFDILRFQGVDVTDRPLLERIDLVQRAVTTAENSHLEIVPSFVIGKAAVHQRIIEAGGEGTVWKKSDGPYLPGRRVNFWVKRKRNLEIKAFVTDFKRGSADRGHADLIGALEFSARQEDGTIHPVAWVTGWTDAERQAMTRHDTDGNICLNPAYLGRPASIRGQDLAVRSKRIRHAHIREWSDVN